jgi:hypothetical protein
MRDPRVGESNAGVGDVERSVGTGHDVVEEHRAPNRIGRDRTAGLLVERAHDVDVRDPEGVARERESFRRVEGDAAAAPGDEHQRIDLPALGAHARDEPVVVLLIGGPIDVRDEVHIIDRVEPHGLGRLEPALDAGGAGELGRSGNAGGAVAGGLGFIPRAAGDEGEGGEGDEGDTQGGHGGYLAEMGCEAQILA